MARSSTLLLVLLTTLAAALSGCGPGEPTAPTESRTYTRDWPVEGVGEVSFERPGNWLPELTETDSGALIAVEVTERERWTLVHLPDAAEADPEALAEDVANKVRERFPDAETTDAQPVTLAGRDALRFDTTRDEGKLAGRRYVVEGGWIAEYEYRVEHESVVRDGFEAMTESLGIGE